MQDHLHSIKEDLLYYVWKTQNFDQKELRTSCGQRVSILDIGRQNFDSGPDFHDCRVEIGATLWVGQVEMHVRSSDWYKHGHAKDLAYSNVILHVVMIDDQPVTMYNIILPCIALDQRVSTEIKKRYQQLQQAREWIPCAQHLDHIDHLSRRAMLDRVVASRLKLKTTYLAEQLNTSANDWEDSFYRLLLRHFGFKTNAAACEQLAQSLPLRILGKHRHSLVQIEALLFGQAGFLSVTFSDPYPLLLQREYQHLKHKYSLASMPAFVWKFMRMRPANFPTIRIAQFAVLFFRTKHLFSKTLAARNVKELVHMLHADVSDYWKTHYRFEEESVKKNKHLGIAAIRLLIINVVVPTLFLYGKQMGKSYFQQHALDLLSSLPAEDNKVVRGFHRLGWKAHNAIDSQAMLALKTSYCDQHKCLQCTIGHRILSEQQVL